ncbi:MAG: isochorismatase family protein [Pseudomonadota bacterium]
MLLTREDSLLLLVDFQERLAPAIHEGAAAVAEAERLVKIARLLDVPCLATEQYPAGLGPTVAPLKALLQPAEVLEKIHFSAAREEAFLKRLDAGGRRQIVVMGMEAHVCVLQTALVLAELDYQVWIVADAIGARRSDSKELALARFRQAGLTIVSAEMVAFEWLTRAATEEFRAVLPLLK